MTLAVVLIVLTLALHSGAIECVKFRSDVARCCNRCNAALFCMEPAPEIRDQPRQRVQEEDLLSRCQRLGIDAVRLQEDQAEEIAVSGVLTQEQVSLVKVLYHLQQWTTGRRIPAESEVDNVERRLRVLERSMVRTR
jgi:hypothetical protein